MRAMASDSASKWNVFIHALETYEHQTGNKVDYLVDMDVTVPLKIAAGLLPFKSKLNLNVWMHLVLPASMSAGKQPAQKRVAPFTKQKLLHVIDNLESFVQGLKIPDAITPWNNYYETTVLSDEYVTTAPVARFVHCASAGLAGTGIIE